MVREAVKEAVHKKAPFLCCQQKCIVFNPLPPCKANETLGAEILDAVCGELSFVEVLFIFFFEIFGPVELGQFLRQFLGWFLGATSGVISGVISGMIFGAIFVHNFCP